MGSTQAAVACADIEQHLSQQDLEEREAEALRMALEAIGSTPSGRHPLDPQVRCAMMRDAQHHSATMIGGPAMAS